MAKEVVTPYIKVFSSLFEEDEAFLSAAEEVMTLRELFWTQRWMKDFLCSPAVKKSWREKVIRDVFDQTGVNAWVTKLVILMLRKGRILQFSNFAYGLRDFADNRCGILRGTVESAVELTSEESSKLDSLLRAGTGKMTVLTPRVNEELLGGLRVKMSQMVLDTSLERKLNDAKIKLLKRRA